jgi:hypothetical protein
MGTLREVTYECEQCGSEIVVKETGETELAPIFCCGVEVREVRSAELIRARPKKKTAKRVKGKMVEKNVSTKKRVETKKKRS